MDAVMKLESPLKYIMKHGLVIWRLSIGTMITLYASCVTPFHSHLPKFTLFGCFSEKVLFGIKQTQLPKAPDGLWSSFTRCIKFYEWIVYIGILI